MPGKNKSSAENVVTKMIRCAASENTLDNLLDSEVDKFEKTDGEAFKRLIEEVSFRRGELQKGIIHSGRRRREGEERFK